MVSDFAQSAQIVQHAPTVAGGRQNQFFEKSPPRDIRRWSALSPNPRRGISRTFGSRFSHMAKKNTLNWHINGGTIVDLALR